jgi:tetratricopeptide (TPR) repeat protein
VAFDLKQLLLFILSPLQIRRRYSLIGFVHEFENRAFIMAQEVDWKGRQLRGRSWKAEREPNGNRREMIQDLTAQIIVDLKVSEITTDWRSYRSFCQGLDSLSAAEMAENRGNCQCVESARNYFQTALGFDPANWMARFYLAVSLCRCGESEIAVSHFSILKRILSESDALLGKRNKWYKRLKKSSSPIVRHLRQYPQCPFLVLYNLAMALSGTLRSCELDQALGTLDKISQAVEGKPNTHVDFGNCAELLWDADRDRFAMLALSARTSILAMQMEYELRQKEVEPKLAKLQSKVQAAADGFDCRPNTLSAASAS